MMKKFRADSRLGSLPEEKQEALFDALERLTLDDGVDWLAGNEAIKVGKSQLSEWLRARRVRALGARLRKFRDEAKIIEGEARGANLADSAFESMFREYALQQMAAGDLSPKDATNLASMLRDSARLALDKRRFETESALAERRLAKVGESLALADRRVRLLEEAARAAKEKLTEALKPRDGGISPETLKKVEEALALL